MRSNPVRICLAATAAMRMRWVFRCRHRKWKIFARISILMLASIWLWKTSSPPSPSMRSLRSIRLRRSFFRPCAGWNLGERIQQAQLLPGDTLDIAFSLDQNEHPELGGLELSLRDFIAPARTDAKATEPEKSTATGI